MSCGKNQATWIVPASMIPDKAAPDSNSRLIEGLCSQMFETFNDKLCHAISALAMHHTTQNPIPDDDYRKIHETLTLLRTTIHNNRAI